MSLDLSDQANWGRRMSISRLDWQRHGCKRAVNKIQHVCQMQRYSSPCKPEEAHLRQKLKNKRTPGVTMMSEEAYELWFYIKDQHEQKPGSEGRSHGHQFRLTEVSDYRKSPNASEACFQKSVRLCSEA